MTVHHNLVKAVFSFVNMCPSSIFIFYSLSISLFVLQHPATNHVYVWLLCYATDTYSFRDARMLTSSGAVTSLLVYFEFEEALHHLCVQHVLFNALWFAFGSSSKTLPCLEPLSVFPYHLQTDETSNQATP